MPCRGITLQRDPALIGEAQPRLRALKGRQVIAVGNALGTKPSRNPTLKGSQGVGNVNGRENQP